MRAADRLRARLDEARASSAFANYLRVREHVLAMKDLEADGGVAAPSAYWREELANVEYLLDASPLVVENLRRHSYHVTGVWPYSYRTGKASAEHAEKLAALTRVAGGRALFVPESPLLGGFGFEIDGALVNLDTLKFFEALVALERGAVLAELRERSGRSYVWEIGAGWGGLAYQVKTLFPDVTYVVVDLPELFLFSATYLLTAFPDASAVFWDDPAADPSQIPWETADFVFVPNAALDAVRPPRLDLTLNLVSFQEMTTAQVEAYVAHAAALGCPYLYSLNRERSAYNEELTGVTEVLGRHYWPHPVDVLPVSYTRWLDERARAELAESGFRVKESALAARAAARNDYRHVVGWLRMPR